MAGLDRAELQAALQAGNVPVSDHNIECLDCILRALSRQYQARKAACEQDLNAQLVRLEESKDCIATLWDVTPLFCAFDPETSTIISRLSDAAEQAIDFLKHEKGRRKVRGDDPETMLFTHLRDVYVGLSGKTGISDNGPLHRFATACTKVIDERIVLPQPQSLRKALKRRSTAPSYFRLKQESQDGVHSVTAQPALPQSSER
jgi:hypothetical protein